MVVDGQGSGHGRGLSAWGTYGLAVNHGWQWPSILDHYYQGTGWGSRGNTPLRVRLMALDNSATTGVISTSGLAIWNGGAYGAVQAVHLGSNVYDMYGFATPACPGAAVPWTYLGRVNGPVVFSTPHDETAAAAGDVLGLCRPDGSVIHYRGTITALNDANGLTRTVNEVAVENYLRGVVSREVSSSWGNAGGGAGMHALWAFSVAARSFALSQGRYSYAQTCDTTSCQVYGGAAYRANPGAPTSHPTVQVCETGNLTFECANTNRAVAETAGVVRVWGDGRVVSTEYSSSHGPYSAGGSFPPVDDWFSNVPQNRNYQWTRTLDAAACGGPLRARPAHRGVHGARPEQPLPRRVGPPCRAAGHGRNGRRVELGLPQHVRLAVARHHGLRRLTADIWARRVPCSGSSAPRTGFETLRAQM